MHKLFFVFGRHVNLTFHYQYNLLWFFTISLDPFILASWLIFTSKKLYDKLVAEASLAGIKEIIEAANKFLEYLIDELSLILWGQLLVQGVLFNDQVEISFKGINHVLLDV